MDDYRIDDFLGLIEYHKSQIVKADVRIARMVRNSPDTHLELNTY